MSDSDDATPQLIVIGSSAGGIDALSTVLRRVPEDMPVPIVIAQHLDPRRPSHLADILRRHTALRVETVEDHANLEPRTVLVLPPGQQAEITDHEIRLTSPPERGPRPSIDLLFTSAAHVFREGLIAVVLTGTGRDGAAGAHDVKSLGGTVVVQNPETASYPGMPGALGPTSVDIVAELDAIGPLLHDLATRLRQPTKPDDERLLRSFLDQLRDRSGIDFGSYKRATILRRLQRRMIATSNAKLRDYMRYVEANPDEDQRLTASFLINVTEFFRDADLFAELRATVIPQLIADARERDRELRVWSAGCATGEEAYSLAMLIADALGSELDDFNVRIFATDVDADAIAFARRGLYAESTISNLPADLVERHFTKTADGYEVRKRIRAMTVFGQHDLGQRAPFPRVDLALCRNVLIYFTTDLQKRALQLFAFALREGGFLALGKAESTTPLGQYFVPANPRLKIYRRHGVRVLIPPRRILEAAPLVVQPGGGARRAPWIDATLSKARDRSRPPSAADKAENILLRLPVGVVAVDRGYDIQSINGAARLLLGIHGPAIGSDLVHLLPSPADGVCRDVIDAAFRGEESEDTVAVATASTAGSDVRSVRLVGRSMQASGTEEGFAVVTLTVSDVTAEVARRHELEEALERERADKDQLVERANQVAASHAALLEANNELTTANAELRRGNEELLVSNEEVQAATEEVETLNEELQATNEELETLNEELQATVEELNTTNDDLQARNLEVLASVDPSEPYVRAVVSVARHILDDDTAVAIIGSEPEVDLPNARFRALFDGTTIEDESGRPVAADDHPVARARRGEAFEIVVTVRRSRRKIGTMLVRSTEIGAGRGGQMMLEAVSVR